MVESACASGRSNGYAHFAFDHLAADPANVCLSESGPLIDEMLWAWMKTSGVFTEAMLVSSCLVLLTEDTREWENKPRLQG